MDWLDDTRDVPLEQYEKVRSRYYDYFARCPGVTHFGSFGSVSSPGLSDLDLIVVVEDQYLQQRRFRLPAIERDDRYIMVHPPLVLPRSLLPNLPYYHLLEIQWEQAAPDTLAMQPPASLELQALHVLRKTMFVQSALWSSLLGRPAVRRTFLLLTSLARSVEWMTRLGLAVDPEAVNTGETVLALRRRWVAAPQERQACLRELAAHVEAGIRHSISLSEDLVRQVMPFSGVELAARGWRGVQVLPLVFLLEGNPQRPGALVDAIMRSRRPYAGATWLGRYREWVAGTFAIVGPLTLAVLSHETPSTDGYRRQTGFVRWGEPIHPGVREAVETTFGEVIATEFELNRQLATALDRARLSGCNFGSVRSLSTFKGRLWRGLARTWGKARLLHLLRAFRRSQHTSAVGQVSTPQLRKSA